MFDVKFRGPNLSSLDCAKHAVAADQRDKHWRGAAWEINEEHKGDNGTR